MHSAQFLRTLMLASDPARFLSRGAILAQSVRALRPCYRPDTVEPVVIVLASSAAAAMLTAAGVLPFLRRPVPPPSLVGWAEALAGGLMLGAAYLLLTLALDRSAPFSILGAAAGVAYTWLVQVYAGTGDLDRPEAEQRPEYGYQLLLQTALHSASEGIAMGLALVLDLRLGVFVVLALGLHNAAEGVALSEILLRRGTSRPQAAALCVVGKASQPLLALATWALHPVLEPLLAGALAFAAGSLAFLVLTELLPSSYRRASRVAIASLSTLSAGAVVLLEDFLV